jgi:hypothetical protein
MRFHIQDYMSLINKDYFSPLPAFPAILIRPFAIAVKAGIA